MEPRCLMRTGARTDTTKIIVSCRNFTNASKKFYFIYAPQNNTFTLKRFRENSYRVTMVLQALPAWKPMPYIATLNIYRFLFYYYRLNTPRSAAPSTVNLSQKVTTPRPRVNSSNRITQMAFTLCVTCYETSHELMSIALHVTWFSAPQGHLYRSTDTQLCDLYHSDSNVQDLLIIRRISH